jgi:sphingomyelin phosphodiesterase
LAQDLRGVSVGSHTSQLLCSNFFGLCPYPAVTPHTISFPQPKPNTSRPPPSGKTPIQVVHISDTHVDLSYETGASYNCTKPICCRPYTTADSPGNNAYPAGPYGEHTCDPPLSLQESMFAAIESLVPNAAFTIFTGDVAAHDVWLVNEPEIELDLNTTYSQMQNLKLVYPVVGNHDTAPVNAFPPAAIQNPSNTAQWAYDTMATDWATWIGQAATQSVQTKYGAYAVKYPGGNLRVISFNSIFYYINNFWLYEEPMEADPSGQLAWLVNELQAAETAGERVWLISHIPSGTGDYFRDYSNSFNQIVSRYDATIAALFYGHTHVDHFEIAYSDYTNPSADNAFAMSYITPSMTPTSGSPSFRVYSVDPDTFGVLDFTEYIADIKSPSYQSGPVWTEYYSAKAAYGPLVTPPLTDPAAELTPAFWHNLTEVFENDDTVFQQYYSRKSRGYDGTTCTGACKTSEICALRAAEAQYNCATVSPGVHFTKRDGEHADECEGSRTKAIFQAIAGRS